MNGMRKYQPGQPGTSGSHCMACRLGARNSPPGKRKTVQERTGSCRPGKGSLSPVACPAHARPIMRAGEPGKSPPGSRSVCISGVFLCLALPILDRTGAAHSGPHAQLGKQPCLEEKPGSDYEKKDPEIGHDNTPCLFIFSIKSSWGVFRHSCPHHAPQAFSRSLIRINKRYFF